MCGVALIFGQTNRELNSAAIARMVKSLHHRGPDDFGMHIDDAVALGHTRLSIVDISTGQQPMFSDDKRHAIVFNGEIYNYLELRNSLIQDGIIFRTRSDTEVILHLYRKYGASCLEHLRGMFVFVIYDVDDKSVFIARDRLGIKPLFFSHQNGIFVAASEIKAIFASKFVEPKLNRESIKNFFTYQFSVAPHTAFENIEELLPGHFIEIKSGGAPRIVQYWDIEFPKIDSYESMDEDYWTQRFRDALQDSVSSHLIGEVPIGAYLSGGIDSSAIAWQLTQNYSKSLKTFSIHFTNPQLDESNEYRAIAKHLKVENDELVMDDARSQGFIKELEKCIYHLEQPQRLSVDIPHFLLSELVQKNGYKVVYTGDGADEILAGYDCFRQNEIRVRGNQTEKTDDRAQNYLEQYSEWFSEDYLQLLAELHLPDKQERVNKQFGSYPAWYDFWHITDAILPGLFTDQLLNATKIETQMPQLIATLRPQLKNRDWLNQSLYIETKTRLPGWILWKSDRLSMAHGVEARVPFMDHTLVELAARIPPEYKLRGMDEKYILKKIAAPNLPTHPSEFKKRGFYSPIREWFFTPSRLASIEPYVSKQAIEDAEIFNDARVHHLLNELKTAPTPDNLNDAYRLMQREWILMLVLTTQILHDQFVRKNAPCFA